MVLKRAKTVLWTFVSGGKKTNKNKLTFREDILNILSKLDIRVSCFHDRVALWGGVCVCV